MFFRTPIAMKRPPNGAGSCPPLPPGEGPGVKEGSDRPPRFCPHPTPLPEGAGAGGSRSLSHGQTPVYPPAQRIGFTLIELLVVVSIIAVLLALLLPALAAVRGEGSAAVCMSNVRQMATAAHGYAADHGGYYPPSYYTRQEGGRMVSYNWDFTTWRDWSNPGSGIEVGGGLLWRGREVSEIQQCPAFDGASNTPADPHTGYNYNTSYIGRDESRRPAGAVPPGWFPPPARLAAVSRPARTALFGDGEYAAGANKFMRAPWPSASDGFTHRHAGTQGYRHRGRTTVAFADGHARGWSKRHTQTLAAVQDQIADGTGFLSPDNSLYDLD